MLCRKLPECADDECAMRQGMCCDYTCVARSAPADVDGATMPTTSVSINGRRDLDALLDAPEDLEAPEIVDDDDYSEAIEEEPLPMDNYGFALPDDGMEAPGDRTRRLEEVGGTLWQPPAPGNDPLLDQFFTPAPQDEDNPNADPKEDPADTDKPADEPKDKLDPNAPSPWEPDPIGDSLNDWFGDFNASFTDDDGLFLEDYGFNSTDNFTDSGDAMGDDPTRRLAELGGADLGAAPAGAAPAGNLAAAGAFAPPKGNKDPLLNAFFAPAPPKGKPGLEGKKPEKKDISPRPTPTPAPAEETKKDEEKKEDPKDTDKPVEDPKEDPKEDDYYWMPDAYSGLPLEDMFGDFNASFVDDDALNLDDYGFNSTNSSDFAMDDGPTRRRLTGPMGGVGPAWTYDETVEKPAGEKDMGSWTAAVYTPEQQARLGVDEQGNKAAAALKKVTPSLRGAKKDQAQDIEALRAVLPGVLPVIL